MARPKKTPKENICKNCDKIFYTRPSHGRDFCSKPCAQQWKGKDKSWLDKRKKTCLNKYGVEVAILSEEVRDKYKNITEVSFMIFRTGSALIVGKCNETLLNEVYIFIKELLQNEYPNICGVSPVKSDIGSSSKKRKIRKKIIITD